MQLQIVEMRILLLALALGFAGGFASVAAIAAM